MRYAIQPSWLMLFLILICTHGCNDSSTSDTNLSFPDTINVVVRVNPASYYWMNNKVTGLDHDLLNAFAKHFDVKVNIIPVTTMNAALEKLNSGEAYIALGALTTNQSLNQKYTILPTYYHIQHKIIYRYSKNNDPHPLAQLPMRKIDVSDHPVHIEVLEHIKKKNKDVSNWHITDDLDSHHLLKLINDGLIDYAIVDSNEMAMTHIFYPYVKELATLSNQVPVVWFMRKNEKNELTEAIKAFFDWLKNTRELNRIIDTHYFDHSIAYADKVTFIEHYSTRLPKYKKHFIDVAKKLNIDWKLIAATAYQESHWKRNAVSPTQVKGLMMITQEIAEQYKVKNRLDSYSSISAGSKHFLEIKNKLSSNIAEPDRTLMALAAYNIGRGHLQDAFHLTTKLGGNPDYWIDVAKSLSLLQKEQWALKSKYGIPKGGNATNYVNNIRVYYKLLMWLEGDISTTIRKDTVPNTYTPPR